AGRERRRPAKGFTIEAFIEQTQPAPVEEQDLHRLAALASKYEQRTGPRRSSQLLAHQAGQTIEAPTQIDRLQRDEDLDTVRTHRAPVARCSASTSSTSLSIARSTPVGTTMR